MPKKLNLDQSGPAWHAWRALGLGGSDAPAIMGDVSWTSPDELLEGKLGLRTTLENDRMRRGKRLEAEARQRYMERTGNEVAPCCVQHDTLPWLRASLDGMSADGKLVLEIKCPSLASHNKALKGVYPDYYKAQLYHQFLTAECEVIHYWSYCPDEGLPEEKEGALVVVERDEAYEKRLLKKLELFQAKVEAIRALKQSQKKKT